MSARERPSALLYPSVDQAACSSKSARPGPATPRLHPYRPLLITTSVMVKVRVVCRIHSASRASDHHPTGVAHNLPRLARKPKLIRPSNSFDDLSRATHPPSTTPPNPCRSPSRRKTPLPSNRPRRYCTHYHHCHHNNPVPFHNPRSLSFYPTRANTQPTTAGHQGSLRLQRTSWRTIPLPLILRRRLPARRQPRKRHRLVRSLQPTPQLSRPGACDLL